MVLLDEDGHRAMVVRTTRPIARGNVMLCCEANEPGVRPGGATVYTSRSGRVVHFPDAKLMVVADSPQTMDACLKGMPALRAWLARGAQHDLTAWVQPVPASLHRCCKSAALLGVPLPAKMKEARLTIDVGAAVDVRVALRFSNAADARLGADLLRSGLSCARGLLLLGASQVELAKLQFGHEDDPAQQSAEAKVLAQFPVSLVYQSEKAMRSAKTEVKGQTALTHFRLPVSGQRLGMELKQAMALATEYTGESHPAPGLFFGACAERAPVTPAPPSPEAPAECDAAIPVTAVPACPPAAKEQLTLAVANFRREEGVLFRQDGDELTFARKLPAREVVDVPTRAGERWVAVFLSAPHKELHVAGSDGKVWLLRESATAPATTMPALCH
jgi:hypothetical protein